MGWTMAQEASSQLDRLELNDAEEKHVNEQIALVVTAVRAGQISGHFADWLIKQLAEETAEAVAARVRLGG